VFNPFTQSGIFKKLVVTRYAGGANVKGVFVANTPTTLTIDASIQPIKTSELKNLPDELRRAACVVKLFTATELKTVAEGVQADSVAYNGKDFDVWQVNKWDALHLPHYEVIIKC